MKQMPFEVGNLKRSGFQGSKTALEAAPKSIATLARCRGDLNS